MRSWIRFLFVFLAVVGLTTAVSAQGFGPPGGGQGGGVEAGQTAGGQFGGSGGQFGTSSAAASPSMPGSLGMGSSGGYAIGPRDVLEISVFGVPELSGTLMVSENGTIQLPLLGETPAAGQTARQLQADLADRLGAEYLQDPQVLVAVKEYNSRYVIVTGAMKNGVYPLTGRTTLMQLVAQAGGFSEAADSTVLILRDKNGQRTAAKVKVSDIEKGRTQDVILQAGDRIVAGESWIKKGYGYTMKALGIAGRFAIF